MRSPLQRHPFLTGRRYINGWWVVRGPDPKVIRLVRVERSYQKEAG